MTKEQIEHAKHQCYALLERNMVKPSTKMGKMMIYAYWMGALNEADELPPFVTICLSCGRYEDLISKE